MTDAPNFLSETHLLPVVVQDATSGNVLMLAYMNREAWERTLAEGEAFYYSRSRQRLWKKGEQSGHVQRVKAIYLDCDEDTVLVKVDQVGRAACHEGYESCFFRRWKNGQLEIVGDRIFDPKQVYGNKQPQQEDRS
ncbi:MAG: phosphoribosyl-AMP cyclohydrolase [Planctomycetales bacterium]|nr:phosphoribosyl-AMP cyclohydrolase [Planctomycetales bacterium]